MPKLPLNNKHWLRGGKLNSKRHFDLTELEKINMATCKGEKDKHPCKNPIYRCSECGNYGCDQEVIEKCTHQGFKNDKCLQCGLVGSRIPVMKDEMDRVILKWEEVVEEIKE